MAALVGRLIDLRPAAPQTGMYPISNVKSGPLNPDFMSMADFSPRLLALAVRDGADIAQTRK
jgi:hypothetical protein